MIKFKRCLSIAALMLWDSFCVLLSLYVAFTLRYTSNNSFNNPLHIPPAYFNNFIYFNSAKERSLEKVAKMVEKNGGKIFRNLQDVADYLNQFKDE